MQRAITLNSLLEMTEEDVKSLLHRFDEEDEDYRKLNLALYNLRTWTGTVKCFIFAGSNFCGFQT